MMSRRKQKKQKTKTNVISDLLIKTSNRPGHLIQTAALDVKYIIKKMAVSRLPSFI